MVTLHVMGATDVHGAAQLWTSAFGALRRRFGLPFADDEALATARTADRINHVLSTDPQRSWVATDPSGDIVGFAQALVRGDLWVLSLLGVAPNHQDRGVGRHLLEEALSTAADDQVAMILSSRDPRAMHRYVRAGFDLHPAMLARGVVRYAPEVAYGVRRSDDVATTCTIDRELQGADRSADIAWMLETGCELWTHDDGGYALTRGTSIHRIAALNETAAAELLTSILGAVPEGMVTDVDWITGTSQWAIRACSTAGLELIPAGAVMMRGDSERLGSYLPNGAFG